jgi:hypothetical protein
MKMEKLDIWNVFDGKSIREVVDYLTSNFDEDDTMYIGLDTYDNLEFFVTEDE